ncbi:hypothetical protein HFN89_05405 [Rhizobium laguerreae]|nr:hypothetical protein [Rhizobium laguerreae]
MTEKNESGGGQRRPEQRRFSLHALLRFVERSSRVPVDTHYLAMVRRRYKDGIVEPPSDFDLIESIEKGSSLERYRTRLRRMLASSRVIHVDETSIYRALGRQLIAVMNPEDRNAVTILTAQIASSKIPQHILEAEGVFEEEPFPTLRPEEIALNSGFLFTVERRRADRARAAHLLQAVSGVEPPVEIMWGRGTLKLVVCVYSRDSLKALGNFGALTVTPYIAEFSEIESHLKEEQSRFPEVGWPSSFRRRNSPDDRPESVESEDHEANTVRQTSSLVDVARKWLVSLGSLLSFRRKC